MIALLDNITKEQLQAKIADILANGEHFEDDYKTMVLRFPSIRICAPTKHSAIFAMVKDIRKELAGGSILTPTTYLLYKEKKIGEIEITVCKFVLKQHLEQQQTSHWIIIVPNGFALNKHVVGLDLIYEPQVMHHPVLLFDRNKYRSGQQVVLNRDSLTSIAINAFYNLYGSSNNQNALCCICYKPELFLHRAAAGCYCKNCYATAYPEQAATATVYLNFREINKEQVATQLIAKLPANDIIRIIYEKIEQDVFIHLTPHPPSIYNALLLLYEHGKHGAKKVEYLCTALQLVGY